MNLEKFRLYFWPIAFWLVSVCFLVSAIAYKFTISTLQEKNSISIKIFNRVVLLPNAFVLDHIAANEVGFKRNEQRIVIGKKIMDKSDFFEYVQKNQTFRSQICDVNLIKIESAQSTSSIIYNDSDFIWFIGVKNGLVDAWMHDLCEQSSGQRYSR